MNPRRTLHLTPLTCPSCNANLPALEDDVAFACAACALAFELERDRLTPRPLRVVPHPAARGGFHLPFWEWDSTTRVPAFNTREVVALSRCLSGRELQTRGAPPRALLGATLASTEAGTLAPFAGLTPPAGITALRAIPFLDEGNHLLETVTGFVLYKESIDRVRSLLAALAP
jgi:hypothetical protein